MSNFVSALPTAVHTKHFPVAEEFETVANANGIIPSYENGPRLDACWITGVLDKAPGFSLKEATVGVDWANSVSTKVSAQVILTGTFPNGERPHLVTGGEAGLALAECGAVHGNGESISETQTIYNDEM